MTIATDSAVEKVEELMAALVTGGRDEPTGAIANEHLATGGKRLRARLALAACEALRVDENSAAAWASACELLHNATLIHDDLQDGDRLRRGKPTTWVQHGMQNAINAGDLLLVLPIEALALVEASSDVRWELSHALSIHASRVIRGQVAEHFMNQDGDASRSSYLRAIEGKTSPLFELPVFGALLLTQRSRDECLLSSESFRTLGVLFQIQDDVLDLYGEKGRDAPGADLREGKISALVVEHLERHPDRRDDLIGLLRLPRKDTPQERVVEMIDEMRSSGTLSAVLGRIQREAKKSREQLEARGNHELIPLLDELIQVILDPISHL